MSQLEMQLITVAEITRRHDEAIEKHFGISALEMKLLQYVTLKGPQKMKDVAQHFDIKLSTFTSIVDKAEAKRVLHRVNSREDRRAVMLAPGSKGKKLYESYVEWLNSLSEKLQSGMHEEGFARLIEGIESLGRISPN